MILRVRFFFLLIGSLSIFFQTILIREFAASFNVNVLFFGVVFFLWLMGGAIGAFFGDKLKSKAITIPALLIFLLFTVAGVLVIWFFPRLMGVYPTESIGIFTKLIIALVSIAPSGFLGGLLFTAGYVRFKEEIAAATAYLFELLGFALGGILTSLVILPLGNNNHIMAVSILLIIVYLLITNRKGLLFAVIFLLMLAVIVSLPSVRQQIAETYWTPLKLIQQYSTPYGKVSVIESNEQHDIYFDGNRIETIPDEISSELSVHIPAMQLNRFKSALIIGGNPYAAAKQLNKYGFSSIQAILLDDKLMRSYRRFSDFDTSLQSKPEIIIGDARNILKDSSDRYDLIIMNQSVSPGDDNARYFTEDLFKTINQSLHSDGVFSFSIASGDNIVSHANALLVNSILGSLKKVFAQNRVLSTPNSQFVSSNRDQSFALNPDYYLHRLDSLDIDNRYLNTNYIDDILSSFRQMQLESRLNQYYGSAVPNSDHKPVAYYYSMFRDEDMLSFPAKSFWLKLPLHRFEVFGVMIALIILAVYLPNRFNPLAPDAYQLSKATVAVSGFSVMLLELLGIHLFQNSYGSVYIYIALLVGLFMAGSAAGLLSGRWITNRSKTIPIKLTQAITVGAFILISTPFLITPQISGLYSIVLILVSGITAGLNFVGATATIDRLTVGKNPAIAYGGELYGAGLAALLAAPIILPVIGIQLLLWLILLINVLIMIVIHNS
ncbi:MAG: hypothetical protein GF315_15200 [candidate division Zixibacteria bacterium]|nr:hypothetical protein [candidate division Zixibacteria bacterium]